MSLYFILLISKSFAQSITGTWYAALSSPAGKVTLVFHVSRDGDTYGATMDSPLQHVTDVPMNSLAFTNNMLTISGPGAIFTYKGKFKADSDKITGTYTQAGIGLPMVFTRDMAGITVKRPQDPKDYPYIREEVTIPNTKADVELAGTLTMPRDRKADKIVVLITGSGPENRDEEMFDHRPFLVLADWLTRNGIAVIRCDDRGVGKSTGDFATATTYDFAEDAEAIVSYIKLRTDLRGMKIGLVGHSEGGVMAMIAANRSNFVDFLVLLASPGVPLKRILMEEVELASGGVTASLDDKLYNYIIQNPTLAAAELDKGIETMIYKEAAKTPDGTIHGVSAKMFSDICKGQGFSGPWFRKYVALEPTSFLAKVQCPVLAINGTLDMVVRSEENLKAIQAALQAGGNKHFEVTAIPDLNHLFQKTTSATIVPYNKIDETFNPAALKKVSDWISALK